MANYGLAPKLPLSYAEGEGPYLMITRYDALLQQNMKMLLLTSPGERIMIPNYGVGLKRVIFQQNTEEVRDAIKERIQEQISRFLDYVKVQNIEIFSEDNSDLPSNYISIKINYFVPSLSYSQVLSLLANSDTQTIV
jgi:phage baseplate assembly protein W